MFVADSIQKKTVNPIKKACSTIFSTVSLSVISACVISLNFLLFVFNGGYEVVDNVTIFNQEFLYILGGVFALSLAVCTLLFFSRALQILFVSIICGLFCFAFINQYSNISPPSILSYVLPENKYFNFYSDFIISTFWTCVVFAIFIGSKKAVSYIVSFVLLLSFCGFLGYFYMEKPKSKQFVEVYNKKSVQNIEAPKKMVYLSFDNLPSYNMLKDIDKKDADILLGFYAKNNFKLFPNAYLTRLQKQQNVALSMSFDKKDDTDLFLKEIEIDGYLNFNKIKDESYFLKQSTLYDLFKKAGYDITSYQSDVINTCKINNENVANTCVDINVANVDLSDKSLNFEDKIILLLSQWVNSFGFGFDIALLQKGSVVVIQSLAELNNVFADINNNKGQTLYFADIKIPSDLFVFDENCKIKPRSKWVVNSSKETLELSKNTALIEQNKCLFAKLQELLDKTDNSNVVYVLTSNQRFPASSSSVRKKFTDVFKQSKLTTFAILDPMRKEFEIDYRICSNATLLSNYLFKNNKCDLSGLNLHEESLKDLEVELFMPIESRVDYAKEQFDTFYENYKKVNNIEK